MKERTIAISRHDTSDFLLDEIAEITKIKPFDLLRPQINNIEIRKSMLENNQVDAAVLPADYVRILNLDRVRGLKYNYFRNTYDDLNVKAVWVVMAREDDNVLLKSLMSLSDVDTLQRIANVNQIV